MQLVTCRTINSSSLIVSSTDKITKTCKKKKKEHFHRNWDIQQLELWWQKSGASMIQYSQQKKLSVWQLCQANNSVQIDLSRNLFWKEKMFLVLIINRQISYVPWKPGMTSRGQLSLAKYHYGFGWREKLMLFKNKEIVRRKYGRKIKCFALPRASSLRAIINFNLDSQ